MKRSMVLAIVAVGGLTLLAASPALANHKGRMHRPGIHRHYHPAFYGRHRAPKYSAYDRRFERQLMRDQRQFSRDLHRGRGFHHRGVVPFGPMYPGIGIHGKNFSLGIGF
jgi:hypothetical protein